MSRLISEFVNLIDKTCELFSDKSDLYEMVDLNTYPIFRTLFNAESCPYLGLELKDEGQFNMYLRKELSKRGCDKNRSDRVFGSKSPEGFVCIV